MLVLRQKVNLREKPWQKLRPQTEVLEKLGLKWKRLVSTGLFKQFHNEAFKIGVYTNIPKGFQDLVYELNGEIRICVSPETKWIVEAGDSLKLLSLQTGNQDPYFIHHGKLEHTIRECRSFSFTNDNLYLVYSCEGSLHALSLQTGTVLTSVTGCNLNYFKREREGFLDVECCCLSSNRREIVLCGEYQIEIWQYAEQSCRFLTRLAVGKPYNSVKFSYCTVSLDDQFLVCCIADIILVYSLQASDIYSSKQVLRGHLGRIEFCRFLKVNRYLISYGVDGMVFLWDLTESKAVGFARVTQGRDSILTMAVSPEEDKAVCFTSSGRVCVIKLCGLVSAMSLKPLTATGTSKVETAETRLPPLEQIPSASQLLTSSVEDDTAEAMSISDSEEDSERDFLDLYLEDDP
ncbi:hypothetical protein ACROYT_G011449 [Oculina patagonica]